ncbi:hypothetical protein [Thalassoglobus sp.]|uniref:hypothetical protein n=1 Tax=Thalassoglobus sp. TaxID=2795869 RepID=UPI003AA960D3
MSTDTSSKPFSIRCPNCQKKLKIEDQRLIGKKVKCPKCKAPFLVQVSQPSQPAKPRAESPAETPAQASAQRPTEPPKPIEKAAASQPAPSAPTPPTPNPVEPPQLQKQVEEEVQLELVTDDPPVGTSAKWVPDAPVLPATGSLPQSTTSPAESVLPNFAATPAQSPSPLIAPATAEASGGTSELNRIRSRRKKGWGPTVIVGTFLLLGIGTVAFLVMRYEPQKSTTSSDPVAVEENLESPVAEDEPYSRSRLENRPQLVSEFEPTSGKPLALRMMPQGVTFFIHVRPSLLWSDDRQYQELKVSLTDDVTNWIAAKLKEICRRDPEEIEEAYIGFLLGASGTEPEICSVVTLKEPAKMSDLIEEFRGQSVFSLEERPDLQLKQDEKYAYLIHDTQTIAIAPRMYAAELEESQNRPFTMSVALENLMRETDDQRLFTVVGIVRDLQLHYPQIMPEASHQTMEQVVSWIGEDVEAISWSVHTDPYFHSEINVHPIATSNPAKVRQRLNAQLETLPKTLMDEVCLKMAPREIRFRDFIGRLPAMASAIQKSTVSMTTANYVSLTTVLPQKAAPNLALATLFTANEAARTDFHSEVVIAAADNKPKLPDTIVERLKIPVDAEFNRTPLEPALSYLVGEVELNLDVDGDALKDAGYTKNMPQTFKLGVVPLEQSLKKILDTYQEEGKVMVMSINEKTKTIHILTEKFAKQKNMPIYKFD